MAVDSCPPPAVAVETKRPKYLPHRAPDFARGRRGSRCRFSTGRTSFVVSTQDLYRGERLSGRSQDMVSETMTIGLVGLIQVSGKTYVVAVAGRDAEEEGLGGER